MKYITIVYGPRDKDHPGQSRTRVLGYKTGFESKDAAVAWAKNLEAYDWGIMPESDWDGYIRNFGEFYSLTVDLEVK